MVRGPKRFFDKTLWPHFVRIDEELRKSLDELADRVIAQAMETSTAEAEVREESPRALPGGTRGVE